MVCRPPSAPSDVPALFPWPGGAAGRKLKAEVAQYDAALERYSGTLAGLQAVPAALGGKENAAVVAEDSRVLAASGAALEQGWRQLEGLKLQRAVQRGGGGAPKEGE